MEHSLLHSLHLALLSSIFQKKKSKQKMTVPLYEYKTIVWNKRTWTRYYGDSSRHGSLVPFCS